MAPLENSHAGFLFCSPSSPHVLEGGIGNVEPSCSADAPAQRLRCMLSGILASGLQHKGTERTASESVTLNLGGLSMKKEKQN